MLIILIISAGIIVFTVKYLYYRSYRHTLADSNFLYWCQNMSVDYIDIAAVSFGYGHEAVNNQLTDKEKMRLINVLREMNVDDISLSNAIDNSYMNGIRLYVRSMNGIEYVFYYSEISKKVTVSTNEENHDLYGDRSNLFVEKQSLISFIKSIDPRKP